MQMSSSLRVITDREIQLTRERAREAGDEQLVTRLQQLLDFRNHGRAALSEHDPRVNYNSGVSWMEPIVNQSGCQWWECKAPASTTRMRCDRQGDSCRLCRVHADEGETRGYWDERHPNNKHWKQRDEAHRAEEARQAKEHEEERTRGL